MAKPQAILDIECYPNFFTAMFMRVEDEKVTSIDRTDTVEFDAYQCEQILKKYEIVTFNGNSYDIPMLRLAMTGATPQKLKSTSDSLIETDSTICDFERDHNLPSIELNHIDLIEIAPGKVSLKIYGGRLHSPKMQDLPIEPHQHLTKDEIINVKKYCTNDLKVTKLVLESLTQQIELRRAMSNQYKVDLRSKSDAQIAEAIIKAELVRKTGRRLPKAPISQKTFIYQMPDFIKPTTDKLKYAIDLVTSKEFTVAKNGRIEMPKELITCQIKIGSSVYQMGMGGLHSTEKSTFHLADRKTLICDWDVASYYPSIILNCELYPSQLGRSFLEVYKSIVDERLEAKATGDKVKADSLKITINGSFGKLGSPYSALYSPELMIQVTVTGQLALLCLIDKLESCCIPVVSGNTDGIVVKCPVAKEEEMKNIISDWEAVTGFVMERADYSGVYSRDVNNYIAIKTDGKVKTKGCFAPAALNKNPQNEICNEALIEYLKNGTEFEDTIRSCKDITKFVTVRSVKGGAVYGWGAAQKYLGKAVRWVYTTNNRNTIRYKSNNNTVARTLGSFPVMDIDGSLPKNLDYDWYIKECRELLSDIGVEKSGQQQFDW